MDPTTEAAGALSRPRRRGMATILVVVVVVLGLAVGVPEVASANLRRNQ